MQDLKTKKNSVISLKYLFFDFVKITAALPGLIAFRTKVVYPSETAKKKIKGGALLISNHLGKFDPAFLQFGVWYRRHHFVCGKDLMDSRGGPILRAFQCIPIDRYNVNTGDIRNIVEHLKNEELVSIFPEGKVNTGNGEVDTFKSGMVLMALKSEKPIIPVYIKPRKKFWHRLTIAIGEPVNVKALCGDRPSFAKMEEVTSLLHQREKELEVLVKY